jgi:hypothetical protein
MKKVRKCLICRAPTIADNRLCKRQACHEARANQRIHFVENVIEPAPVSGKFISLKKCTHGIQLSVECIRCEEEWEEAQYEGNDNSQGDSVAPSSGSSNRTKAM